MKSIASAGALNSQANTTEKLNDIYKNLVFKILRKISIGQIVLIDKGQNHIFGARTEAVKTAYVTVLDRRFYRMMLSGGTIGAGEAYMLGYWKTDDLVGLVQLMLKNRSSLQNMESKFSWFKKKWSSLMDKSRINSVRGSKRNIVAHYDLSNEFFSLFLDPKMMYSSAIYDDVNADLNSASVNKLKHICERLSLKEGEHLLEIGSGWGGMAIYAAQNYGCKVTTTTISNEQYDYAKEQIEMLGLESQITLLKKDYRALEGKFDKLVSIEMIEAVGHQFYDQFFTQCSRLLKPDGLALIQAITTTDSRYELEKNQTDFIRRYIFPGGCLPSNNVIFNKTARYTNFQCVGFEDITLHYARTLKDWREKFMSVLPQVSDMGFDDVFSRMWEFYLAYCEGGFRERQINTAQFLFAKPEAQCLPPIK